MSTPISQKQVCHMFNAISQNYDRANRLISLGTHRYLRRKLLDHIEGKDLKLLDCATGTCDQLLALMDSERIRRAVGMDLASEMLAIGQEKIASSPHADRVELILGDALNMPLEGGQFDCVTMAFGIRNIQGDCLPEIARVLKSKGQVLILEFSLPNNQMARALYLTYLRHLLPLIGGWVSGNREAYRYLNRSIETFASKGIPLQKMEAAGFQQLEAHPMALGAVTLYKGVKR